MSRKKKHPISDIPAIRTDKELLITGAFSVGSLVVMTIWAMVVSKSDVDEYSGIHHALFTLCFMNLIAAAVMKSSLFSVVVLFYRNIKGTAKMYAGDIGYLLHLIAVLLIPFIILFILDLSFIQSYGVKISVTATVMLILGVIEYVKIRHRKTRTR